MLYLLADEIYPHWPLISRPMGETPDAYARKYSKQQEEVRKDVERFFGILQSSFEILRREN